MANLGTQFYRLTVSQYHEMIDNGILTEGEPYELIDGYIVRKDRSAAGEDPMTVGNHHSWVVQKLIRLNGKLDEFGCHIRIQQPISLPPRHEPEPDAAIVVGTEDSYRNRKPRAKDALCVIEVADASVKYDQKEKLRVYASNGIKCYVIINLMDRIIELYTEPSRRKGEYARSTTLRSGQNLQLPVKGERHLSVPVRT
ncbi:MAG TPA: Uma2 family endonuclease, partial [Tepidisphaeraceae bacterium]|nr:Uma2 family endonuclease [Tepidisphaeraceae bacterium]